MVANLAPPIVVVRNLTIERLQLVRRPLVRSQLRTHEQSEDAVFTINNNAFAGVTNSDDLTISGLPAGAVATFGTNPLPINSATTLTISGTAVGCKKDWTQATDRAERTAMCNRG